MRRLFMFGLVLASVAALPQAEAHSDHRGRDHGGHGDHRGHGRGGDNEAGCFMSHDEACGEVRWVPPPEPNDPATLTVTATPDRPRPGEAVTFRLVADDPDAGHGDVSSEEYGDGPGMSVICDPFQFGTWPTPPEEPAHLDETRTHTYQRAGTYVARFEVDMGCGTPYRSFATAEITITVAEPPNPPTCVGTVCLPS